MTPLHLAPLLPQVHAVRWSLDGMNIFSASDDKSVKAWDVPTQECLWTQAGAHSDYVRAAVASPSSPHAWASGGYDKHVCMWDVRDRDSRPTVKVDHGAPVEDLLFLPGGSLLMSAGGNSIKVWDVLGGGRAVHTLNNHQKTITSLCLDSTRSRLLSAGLDGHVKIYSVHTFAVTHGVKYNAPVLSLAMSPDNMSLVVGTSDGVLSTRRREVKGKPQQPRQRSAVPPEQVPGGTAKYFERGKSLKSGGDNRDASEDLQALVQRKQRLRSYDMALRKFRYHEALDAALASRNPTVVVTVLEELVYRQGLHKALSGRDEVTLEPLLSFLSRYTTNPRYAALLVDVCRLVLEMYKAVLGQSEAIDELFTRLGRHVKLEVGFQRDVLQLLGSMGAIMHAPSSHR